VAIRKRLRVRSDELEALPTAIHRARFHGAGELRRYYTMKVEIWVATQNAQGVLGAAQPWEFHVRITVTSLCWRRFRRRLCIDYAWKLR